MNFTMKALLLLALFVGARAGYFTVPAVAIQDASSQAEQSAGGNGIYYSNNGGQYRTSVTGNGVGAASFSSSGGTSSFSQLNSAAHSNVSPSSAAAANVNAVPAAPAFFSAPVATFAVSSGPSQVYSAPAAPAASTPVSATPRYAGFYAAPAVVSYPAQSQVQTLYGQTPTVAPASPPAVFPVNAALRYTAVSAAPLRYTVAPSAPRVARFSSAVLPAAYSVAPSSSQAVNSVSANGAVGTPFNYAPAAVPATYSARVETAPVYTAPVSPRYVLTPFRSQPASGGSYTPSTAGYTGVGVSGQATAAQVYSPVNICPVAFSYASSQDQKVYGGGYGGGHVKYVF